ncbi:MAG: hypothetical protein IPM79_19255 [Polyangiaceae bacterium]|nr:hypothetical protein [Polyangiaceae bacterium]
MGRVEAEALQRGARDPEVVGLELEGRPQATADEAQPGTHAEVRHHEPGADRVTRHLEASADAHSVGLDADRLGASNRLGCAATRR